MVTTNRYLMYIQYKNRMGEHYPLLLTYREWMEFWGYWEDA
jgi:hypothetical protein